MLSKQPRTFLDIRRHVTALVCMLVTLAPVYMAGQVSYGPMRNCYVGVTGGILFGTGTFSSFGHDGTNAGYSTGLVVGTVLNAVISAEIHVSYGSAAMSARDCCSASGYWLGSDGMRYPVPVAGMAGWFYDSVKSRTHVWTYGTRLNVNMLALSTRTNRSPWAVNVSPMLAAVNTSTRLSPAPGGSSVNWHLGAGAGLLISRKACRRVTVGAYTRIMHLTGCAIDGMPRHIHGSNFIWETGIRLCRQLP